MDERTLEALKGSIAKWEAIVAGKGEDNGPVNCPLCHLFHSSYRKDGGEECSGCPVYLKTGETGCSNTPYDRFAMEDGGDYKQLAEDELEFLRSLLPEGAHT
jgi:hypothetical protein